MKIRIASLTALGGLALAVTCHAVSLPIQIDGDYADWTPGAVIGTDPAGDAGTSGIDFTEMWAANDEAWAFLRFDTTVEVQGDEQQNIVLGLDTDRNPATGLAVGSIGADVVWRFGQRAGSVYTGGPPVSIDPSDLGLVLAPTVSDTQFELALDRSAAPGGEPLFPESGFDLYLWDDDGGDGIGPLSYEFAPGEQPVPSISLDRDDPAQVRIASYNVQNDGLFTQDAGRIAALGRILGAVDPDIWIFCEVWNHDAAQVAAKIEQFLPSGPGESWSAVKLDPGNAIVSRLPILDSWEVFPGNRLTAVLVDARPRYDTDLLVVANHWSCCTADAARQDQADALISFLRDARTPGGVIDLPPQTPIVAAGDFNLVGWRRQLETLLTGDIADNGTWGPDSPPDWDGSEFDVALDRHPDARFLYTWRDDGSSYCPGKLDYMVYTGSAALLANNIAVETRSMTPASLGAAGLHANDTPVASDHAPIVGDFSFGAPTGVAEGDRSDPIGARNPGARLLFRAARPNPFGDSTTLAFFLPSPGAASLDIFDVRGRLVRTLLRDEPLRTGSHQVIWDGTDDTDRPVAPGLYTYRLRVGRARVTGSVTRVR